MNKKEENLIKNIGLKEYSKLILNKVNMKNYEVLDCGIKNHKRVVLLQCPNKKHKPYWTNLSVIKKGHGCRKCCENPELLTNKKIEKIKEACKLNNCEFIKIIPREVKCVKALLIEVQDSEGYLYNITFDTLKYRKTKFMVKFNSNPYIFYNINLWLSKNRPEYILCDEDICSIYKKHSFKYIGKEQVTTPYFRTTFSSFLSSFIEHPEFKKKKSKGHRAVRSFFQELNIIIEEEKSFEDLLSPRGYHLFFDFYLPDYNCVIEVDGDQHSIPVSKFGGEDTFLKLLEHDKIKNEYCEKNHIDILRIPYKHIYSKGRRSIIDSFKKEIVDFLKTITQGGIDFNHEYF